MPCHPSIDSTMNFFENLGAGLMACAAWEEWALNYSTAPAAVALMFTFLRNAPCTLCSPIMWRHFALQTWILESFTSCMNCKRPVLRGRKVCLAGARFRAEFDSCHRLERNFLPSKRHISVSPTTPVWLCDSQAAMYSRSWLFSRVIPNACRLIRNGEAAPCCVRRDLCGFVR